jgi:hypothetical protein
MDRKTETPLPKTLVVKKKYCSPSLVEYGSLSKLTQGMTGSIADMAGMSMILKA